MHRFCEHNVGSDSMEEKPRLFKRYWMWILWLIIVVAVVFYGVSVYLNWTILQAMYDQKAGLDWFNIVFYHNYTFILAAIFSLLILNPLPGRSDLYEAFMAFQEIVARSGYVPEPAETPPPPLFSLKGRKMLWAFWQLVKWAAAFGVIASINGLPFLGDVTLVFYMMLKGFGNWGLISRIFALPIMPASDSELVALMPTMEIQYRFLYVVLTAVLTVIAVRMSLKLVRHFLRKPQNTWARDIFVILTCIMLAIILGAPYWAMDATTPFDYILCIILFASFLLTAVFLQFRSIGNLSFAKRRRIIFIIAAVGILVILGVNAAIIAGYRLNWNNNWIQYEWKPLTEKRINVTRWSAGIQGVEPYLVSEVPTGNISNILSVVRQWDQSAAYTKMKNQIGVNWMTLSDSDIIYINGHEYWAAPTSIVYPSTDWISAHLVYTHSSKIIVVDSHTGEFVPVTEAFGVKAEPLIYYGEGFNAPVYTNVKGFDEIGNVSYSGQPDYILSGWQRMLWFLLQGQVGFAFSPPQESIKMLYNRDVLQRVRSTLINGLTADPDPYLVSDGNRVYYAVQVYIDYPMHSGFSASKYLRYFAVVLVDIEDGSIHGYIVGKPDGFFVDFYKGYYPSWEAPLPSWLVPQLRYPEALLGKHDASGQLDVDFRYHVSDPFVWRSGSQFYERPPATEALYILMTVQNQSHFIGLQIVEFLGSHGKNLAGIYVAYGGPELGRIDLYRVQNATKPFIGPSAALQALETDDYVRKQLTLLTNPRTGNILLYSIGNKLYYFIPVYITIPAATAVITKMAFIGVVDAATGTQVAAGLDSVEAYYTLTGTIPSPQVGAEESLNKLKNVFASNGYNLVNTTEIHANVEIQVNTITYTSEEQWNQTEVTINDFIQNYVQKYGSTEVYYWNTGNHTINFGILTSDDIMKLYYTSVQYR